MSFNKISAKTNFWNITIKKITQVFERAFSKTKYLT